MGAGKKGVPPAPMKGTGSRAWHPIAMAVLAFVVYHVGAFTWVCYTMMSAAQKPNNYGLCVTLADQVRARFPVHFELMQSMTALSALLPNRLPGC